MRTNTVFSEKQQINTILLLMSRKHTKFPAFLLPIFRKDDVFEQNRTQFHGAFETAAPRCPGVALSSDHPGAVPGVSREYRVFHSGAQHQQGGGCGLALSGAAFGRPSAPRAAGCH